MRIQLSDNLDYVQYSDTHGFLVDEMNLSRTLHPDHIFCGLPRFPNSYSWRGINITYDDPKVFRPSLDSFLLVSFFIKFLQCHHVKIHTIADIGAGTGIIGVNIAAAYHSPLVYFVDSCPHARALTRSNASQILGFSEVVVVEKISSIFQRNRIDFAFSNPPYYVDHFALKSSPPGLFGNEILPKWVASCISHRIPLALVLPHMKADPIWLLRDVKSGVVCSIGSALVLNRHANKNETRLSFKDSTDGTKTLPSYMIDFLLCHDGNGFGDLRCNACKRIKTISNNAESFSINLKVKKNTSAYNEPKCNNCFMLTDK